MENTQSQGGRGRERGRGRGRGRGGYKKTTSAKVDSEEVGKCEIGGAKKVETGEDGAEICGASIAGPVLALFLSRMQTSQS